MKKKSIYLFLILSCLTLGGCSASTEERAAFVQDAEVTGDAEKTMQNEEDTVRHLRSIVRIGGKYYVYANEGSVALPEGYEKTGEVAYSDEEKLPEEDFVMIPNDGDLREIYQKAGDDDAVYVSKVYESLVGDKKEEFKHYCRYEKEENPDISVETPEGFYSYINMDGKSFFMEAEVKIESIDNLKKLGTIDAYNEKEYIEKNGYGGQEDYLGYTVYQEESENIYYVNTTNGYIWYKLTEDTN
ncbi:MAG: hypothetical protein NC300_11550 [Bacteroidales bacterium]|nr:hypothetical protein [Clostridium sp.]MCM1204766.1 hypothetical protein [Bacteroidales bacterium]